MSSHEFTEYHHEDKTGKWITSILVIIVFVVGTVALTWNESSKTAKKIVKSQAAVDSLSHEIEWRQKVLIHHDSLQTLVNDTKHFQKLPFKTRQEITTELLKTSPKLTATKHNIQILENLLKTEKQTLAKLKENKLYNLYH
jgi:hypothetical protein